MQSTIQHTVNPTERFLFLETQGKNAGKKPKILVGEETNMYQNQQMNDSAPNNE